MKKLILPFALIAMMSCGEGEQKLDGAALAKAVCDCNATVNAMESSDPNRSAEQAKCGSLNMTNYQLAKKGNVEKGFNEGIANCK